MHIPKRLGHLLAIIGALLSIAVILFTNYQIIHGWFGKNGPADLGSIEVSYVTMGRYFVDFGLPFFGTTWIPFWYFGFPLHLIYTPFLPLSEAILHSFFGMPLWESYRFTTGMGFILAPVSVFFLGWVLSKRVIGGAIAAMFFTVGPTLFYWLADGVAGDKFSPDFWDPRRLTILARWGEGPHTISLMFIPLVGVFFALFLEKKKSFWLLFAAICLGFAGLTNAIGLFSSILLMMVMAFVKYTQDVTYRRHTLFAFFIVGILALGLISFWYNLSFIHNFFAEGGGTGKMLMELFPWGWVGGIFGIFIIYFLISKVIRPFGLAVTLLWFVIFFTVVYVYYSTGTMELLPQALRYNVEVDMSFSLLLGVAFALCIDFLGKRLKGLDLVGNGLGILIVIALFFYIQPFLPTANKVTSNVIDLKKTGEYDISTWLDAHMDKTKGERVFLPGNYGFYFNYFTNNSQHRGALFQAAINPWPDHMHYQMSVGKNAQIAHAWLVIANEQYLVVTGPGTREMYKEIKNPERFETYEPVYALSGDIIYKVPLKRPSLAKPVNLSQMAGLQAPKKGDDKVSLFAYSDWVENSSTRQTSLTVESTDSYRIKGTVGDGEGILVQMAADSPWHAKDNATGNGVAVKSDPMKFVILYPQAGPVDITLTHGKALDEWLGYLVSLVTIIFIIWYSVAGRKRFSLSRIIGKEKAEHKEKKEDVMIDEE